MGAAKQSGQLLFVVRAQQGEQQPLSQHLVKVVGCYGAAVGERMEWGAEGGWKMEEAIWEMQLCWPCSMLNPHGVSHTGEYSVQLTRPAVSFWLSKQSDSLIFSDINYMSWNMQKHWKRLWTDPVVVLSMMVAIICFYLQLNRVISEIVECCVCCLLTQLWYLGNSVFCSSFYR